MKTPHDFERKPAIPAVASVAQSTDPRSLPPLRSDAPEGQNKSAQGNALGIADKKEFEVESGGGAVV
jgi:hypothetical protein